MLSFCFCHKAIPSPVRLLSAVTIFSRSPAKCAKHGVSDIIFCILLKSTSSLSVQFRADFFRSSCLIRSIFSESLGRIFAIFCFAPSNYFSSLLDVGDFNVVWLEFFFLSGIILCWFISCHSQVVSLRKAANFFSLALYLVS